MSKLEYRNQSGTLVVVDMQPDYEASSHPWTITKVKKAITSARHAGWGIVIVEFADHSPTHNCLLKPLMRKTKYEKFTVVEKDIPDGSEQIIAAIRQCEFEDTLIRVCGVNTDQCVQETVSGLARKLERSKIEVITDACNCDTGNRWKSFETQQCCPSRQMVAKQTSGISVRQMLLEHALTRSTRTTQVYIRCKRS